MEAEAEAEEAEGDEGGRGCYFHPFNELCNDCREEKRPPISSS